MRFCLGFLFGVNVLLTAADGLQSRGRRHARPAPLSLPIERRHVEDPMKRDRLRRRSDSLPVTLENEETLYYATVSIGTPAQDLRVQIDTGSSDLWVNSPSSTSCERTNQPCKSAGTYTANSSSTYSFVSNDFNITYVDGSGASGDYATDKFEIGGTTLDTLQFGIGYTSTSNSGVLGVGYEVIEAVDSVQRGATYKNLPAQLLADGVIEVNAYSLWLNDLDASTGQILFGGVDTAKYEGSLSTLPIQQIEGVYAEFYITLTKVTFGNSVVAENQALAVLLDSGTSLTYLPNAMTEAIYEAVDAQYDEGEGAAYVPCSLASNSTTLDFTFSSPTISVALDELILQVTSSNGQAPTFSNGEEACLFGIIPSGDSFAIMGDTFLRSAYVVYNLAENEISIAQTNFDASGTNVQAISSGTSGVPNASKVTDAASATAGIADGPDAGTQTLGISFATSTSKSGAQKTAAPAPARARLGAMAAVGAGIAFAAM